jgi:hypothetical protein
MFENHGCLAAYYKLIRYSGSPIRSLEMRFLAYSEIFFHFGPSRLYSPFIVLSRMSPRLHEFPNGKLPESLYLLSMYIK